MEKSLKVLNVYFYNFHSFLCKNLFVSIGDIPSVHAQHVTSIIIGIKEYCWFKCSTKSRPVYFICLFIYFWLREKSEMEIYDEQELIIMYTKKQRETVKNLKTFNVKWLSNWTGISRAIKLSIYLAFCSKWLILQLKLLS